MKFLIILLIPLFMVSCASNDFDKRQQLENEIAEHLSQEDKMIGDNLPTWTQAEGVNAGFVYAVGEAEYSVSQKETMIKQAASHNAKMRIVSQLPSDYKYFVQNALSNASNGEFNQIEIVKGDLYGLRGVVVSRKHTTCRKMIRYTEFGTKVNRICYVQASVPVKNLNDAIVRTIKEKYGDDTGNKFKKILEDQLQQDLISPKREVAE